MLCDTCALEEGSEFFILTPPPPISLNCDDFPYQTDIQQVVGIHVAKYIRLVFNWIYPSEFTIIIDEGNIVFESSNKRRGMTPYI
jgi:hypothetical protein